MSIQNFNIEEYRRERCHELERQVDYLRAERDRLLQLLAEALRVAVAGTGVTPTALLDVLGDLVGTNLACGAFIGQRERRNAQALMDRVLRVLRETA